LNISTHSTVSFIFLSINFGLVPSVTSLVDSYLKRRA
jgi:hypothetical protein